MPQALSRFRSVVALLLLGALLLPAPLPAATTSGKATTSKSSSSGKAASATARKSKSAGKSGSKGVPQGTDLSRLNQGNLEKNYRRREFRAYRPLRDLWKTLYVGQYSSYENPTGLYFKEDERIVVTVSSEPDGELQFIINDYGKDGKESRYPLRRGVNEIKAENRGLGYVDYRSSKGGKAHPITVSFRGGVINGIFSHHDNARTWRRLITRAKAEVFDMVGERCQVVFTVDSLREGDPDKGVELLKIYDEVVECQQKLMGWDQQGIHPGNHIMCRVVWKSYMYADGKGSAFNVDTLPGLTDPVGLRNGCWGVAHELGHNNQIRPGFCWVGTTEVTNNLFSAWCSYKMGCSWLRLEHENESTADGQRMRGGRMDTYLNLGVLGNREWQLHKPGDHFVTLCPLWQLLLYCQVARGTDDFFPEVFRLIRKNNGERMSHGQARVNFFRYVAQVAKLDLSDFLQQTGILVPMDCEMEDYTPARLTITRKMVSEAQRHLARYDRPDSSVIHYINANNVEIYRQRANVEPSRGYRLSLPGKKETENIVIPADKWKNAVAFEVYGGDKLLRVSLRGLGQEDNASTTVICPPGTTEIKAVQWDGERFTVAGRPSAPDGRR